MGLDYSHLCRLSSQAQQTESGEDIDMETPRRPKKMAHGSEASFEFSSLTNAEDSFEFSSLSAPPTPPECFLEKKDAGAIDEKPNAQKRPAANTSGRIPRTPWEHFLMDKISVKPPNAQKRPAAQTKQQKEMKKGKPAATVKKNQRMKRPACQQP